MNSRGMLETDGYRSVSAMTISAQLCGINLATKLAPRFDTLQYTNPPSSDLSGVTCCVRPHSKLSSDFIYLIMMTCPAHCIFFQQTIPIVLLLLKTLIKFKNILDNNFEVLLISLFMNVKSFDTGSNLSL